MSWLVTGGAGYIGAHVVRALLVHGHRVAVFDDLSSGDAARLAPNVPLLNASILDRAALDLAMRQLGVTGVIHLAAKKRVGESAEMPLMYFRENLQGLQEVLESAIGAGVRQFVFSSSAAVYGASGAGPITEDAPCVPISPYGQTKLAGEWMVRAAAAAHGLSCICLRYFNVAGAASADLGDTFVQNLVPIVFDKLTRLEPALVFGDDYPTPDGTCIRDYIHVADLARAHVAAAERLGGASRLPQVLNVGRGVGVSVSEMLRVIQRVTGHRVTTQVAGRRPGDPPRVVASADAIRVALNWHATLGIEEMVASAWEGWCRHYPQARKRDAEAI